ncbi:MAG: cation-translocating P-type ATPase [Bacteroidia bacterium]|nr:cation-translocating P-type ATPase [Bacteroidia bacterium]
MHKGLNSKEVNEKLNTHGYNELPSAKPKNVLGIAFEVMKEPMFILLISCGVLYMILGDYKEGAILLSTILIIIFITFYQYQKTEKALQALRQLSAPKARAIRDGKEIHIESREIVPDDLLLLREGDRVPADSVVLDSVNLTIDESLLTGESVPVLKNNTPDEVVANVFSGTMVVSGKGTIRVTDTGSNTQFGKIGTSLRNIEQDETRLQKEMKILIRNLFIIGAVLSIGVVLAYYFTRGNLIQSILNGLSSAMAILPEEFPVVLTVFLALGSWKLSKNNVLTRKPSAIETLGSATVLCTDKTGTITMNKMDVASVYSVKETVDKDGDWINLSEDTQAIILTSLLASQKNSADPMEQAIEALSRKVFPDTPLEYTLIKEYPLSKEQMMMTCVTRENQTKKFSVSAKGAPEVVMDLCRLKEEEKATHKKRLNQMAEKGYRVIAVADSEMPEAGMPEEKSGFDYRFLGLIGFHDPIRPEVPKAVKECQEAGIKVIMITGDFPVTARSIANEAGIKIIGEIISGEELNDMTDAALKKKIKHVSVFARVIPEQKLRIVQALKSNHEVVAMTGDGVNDAPALKASDIGIAMGKKGTDVARAASSLVLLDDNFASVVGAIRSGRRIFDNLQKAMSYIIAIHIPIVGLSLLPAFMTKLPLLLMPLHIIFMELIIDPVCSVAFESEQEEKSIMNRPPRNPDKKFFGGRKILMSVLQGLMLLSMVIIVYFLSIREGHSDGEIRAITFSALITGNVFLILSSLSRTRSFLAVFTERNYAVMIILTLTAILLLLVLYIPFLQDIFGFQSPGFYHFIPSLAGASIMLIILEGIKLFNFQRNKK